jgi:hypothetical protein
MRMLGRALTLFLLLVGSTAQADDSMRCGPDLVWLGWTQSRIQSVCGNPTYSERREINGRRRAQQTHQIIDIWTYDRGPSEFVRSVVFTDGTATGFGVGDYGSAKSPSATLTGDAQR